MKGLSTINARSETITKAPTWREPFKKRRCLVPVSAFYEWPKEGKPPKQPYAFKLTSGGTFAFAGLWDAWKDKDGHWLQSYAIVTTEANELMSRIHPRIPVILHSRDYDRWLDREETERLPLDLLRPYESDEMEVYEANPKVNSVRNNRPRDDAARGASRRGWRIAALSESNCLTPAATSQASPSIGDSHGGDRIEHPTITATQVRLAPQRILHPMSSSQLLLPVFSSVIGMAVSVLLLILLYREPLKDNGIRVGMLLAVAVCVFFGALCATAMLTFEHVSRSSGIWKGSAGALAISAAVLPSLILWSWHASPVLRWRGQQSRVLLSASWLWTAGVLVLAWIKPEPKEVSYLNQVVGLSGVVSLAPACISILRLPLERRLHAFLRATCLIYLASACLSMFVPSWSSKPTVFLLLIALLRLMLLLIAFVGSFVLAARFRLADVFVRWGTRITSIGLISLTGTLLFSTVLELFLRDQRPLALLALASLIGTLLLFGTLTISRYSSWVECYVLGKVNLHDALSSFRSLLFSHRDQDLLFATTQAALTDALQAEAVRLVNVDVLASEISIGEVTDWSVIEVSSDLHAMSIPGQRNVEYLAPVIVNKVAKHVACISPGLRRRALVSSEITFVEEATQQLGLRLEQIEAESTAYRLSLRESLLSQQLAEAELRALRAQVNPHFLFNSLNTIADLIVRDPDVAERLTVRLGQVFRHVLASSSRQFVTLSEEFSFLRHYLDIEQERFGDSLSVLFELHPEANELLIPSLLLQPLVENAIKHGLAHKFGKKQLAVRASLGGSRVHLEVCDNGVGFSEGTTLTSGSGQELSEGGVGLANTLARLRTAYGTDAELELRSMPMSGCQITLSFEARRACGA